MKHSNPLQIWFTCNCIFGHVGRKMTKG